jgi:hypothetical protein
MILPATPSWSVSAAASAAQAIPKPRRLATTPGTSPSARCATETAVRKSPLAQCTAQEYSSSPYSRAPRSIAAACRSGSHAWPTLPSRASACACATRMVSSP